MDSLHARRPRLARPVLIVALLMLGLLSVLLFFGRTLLPGFSQPAAAQDGLIAFEHYVESDADPPQIAVINASGTGLIPFPTDGRAFDPVWSPDGTKLAVASDREDNALRIYLMDTNGENLTQLSPEYGGAPAWAPADAAPATPVS